MSQNDPASLANLNDIVMPPAVGWWPLAGGWYVLAALIAVVLAWYVYRSVKHWKANTYRRAALFELQSLIDDRRDSSNRALSLRRLPALLKRTALSVYPRQNVAALTGDDWLQFLNSKMDKPSFTRGTFETLNRVSYSTGNLDDLGDDAVHALIDACRSWLKDHRAVPAAGQQGGS